MAKAYASVMAELWSNQRKVFSPGVLKKEVGLARPDFKGMRQQDSQELLLILLDRLGSDLCRVRAEDKQNAEKKGQPKPKRVAEKLNAFWISFLAENDSIITDHLTGVERYTIRCLTCGSASIRHGTYNFLSVDIPTKWSMFGSSTVQLSDCLATYVKEEVVDDVKCDKCKAKRQKKKGTKLETSPDILIIHLKRFKMGWSSGEKIRQFVNFPVSGLKINKLMANSDHKNAVYDLTAVSNHRGDTRGGHYTAYARNPLNDTWYEFNDRKVTKSTPSSVVTPMAYLLFYTRRR